ncbi:hypothetical protein M9458_004999, partial [Cirrhinus mrigala]
SLADTQRTGKLTKEQFCLAMHLIQEKVKGVEPPQSLTPEMIPPSERGSSSTPVRGQNTHMHDKHPLAISIRIPLALNRHENPSPFGEIRRFEAKT